MADIIRILPSYVAHQIAAGEVVQNPASVVKELLENALDAETKSIILILQDSGKSLIKVIDDGIGMSISDAKMSFFRYATSKIKSADDLLKIRTMGFRGEALASIATVCQVEMQTKRKEDEIGVSLFIEGNKLKGENFIQTSTGTIVTVKNIFYNIPARRKFLKSNEVELRKIMEEFNRLLIAYPKVRFILYHKVNNKLKKYFDFPSVSLYDRIIGFLGKKNNIKMIYIDEQMNNIHLKGYIINPNYSNNSIREQFIFVNNRFIKNSFLSKTVLNAFNGFLTDGVFPSYFLFFFMDPTSIDVNIHPTKNEIKFDDESSIYKILYNSIRNALGICNIKTSSLKLMQYANYKPLFNPQEIFNISIKKLHNVLKSSQCEISSYNYVIFQLYNKYIISNIYSDIMIIDQHRAHKRILYEYLLYNRNLNIHVLQEPISLFFSNNQINLIEKFYKYLIDIGFSIHFYRSRFLIKSTPIKMNKDQINNFFTISLLKIDLNLFNDEAILEILIKTLANVIAIKHGLSLSIKDMNHIIYELFYLCKEPNFTPSGKKIFIILNNNHINNKFS